MSQNPNLPITSIVLVVSDLDKSTGFYRDILGLELARSGAGMARFRSPGAGLTLWSRQFLAEHLGVDAGKINGKCRRTMIACNLASEAHVDEMHSRIVAQRVEFLAPPALFEWNAYAGYFLDPDGNFIELFSWADKGPLDVVIDTDAPRFAASRNVDGLTITSICLFVPDMAKCLDFYTRAMGMRPTRLNLEDGFANFSGSGSDFSMWDLAWTERSIGYRSAALLSPYQGTIIECELPSSASVDRECEHLSRNGAQFVSGPAMRGWGAHAAFLADPEGILWCVTAPAGQQANVEA